MNENTIKTNETSTNTKEETAMAANSNSTATSTNAKTGSVRYYVTTDTHGYPWGRRGTTTDNFPIDFDLGDNTAGYVNKATGARVLLDPPEEMNAKIAILGNHDTSVLAARGQLANHPKFKLQIYKDTANKIAVYGLDTCTDDVNVYEIPVDELMELAASLAELGQGWDVIILSHAPLFEGNAKFQGLWPAGGKYHAPANYPYLYKILRSFILHKANVPIRFPNQPEKVYNFSRSNGHVIGCFCGHVHGHFKSKINLDPDGEEEKKVYVPIEAFSTNGSNEWTAGGDNLNNHGAYIPYEPYINVNYDTKTINGTSFVNYTEEMLKVIFGGGGHDTAAKCHYLSQATGSFQLESPSYPKFYKGCYIGYTKSKRPKSAFGSNRDYDRYWHLDNTIRLSVKNLATGTISTITAQNVWFDTNGRLRYASASRTGDTSAYQEIVNYKAITITLQSGGVSWKFVNGLLDSIIPPYKSGTLVGKNGWAFYFDSQGKPYGMAQNGGTPVNYGKGENWMNVYEVKLFNSVGDPLTDVPQIGATGAFATTGIDMARERITGANQISSTKDMLMRVLGGNDGKTVYWLYEGRLTSLTDSTTHHPEG